MIDDPIALLERELIDAARRRAATSGAARRRWPGAAALVASLLITVGVAAAVLTTRGGVAPRARSAATSTLTPGNARLMAVLAVLRRPQTATDSRALLRSHVIGSSFGGPAIVATARLATVTPWGARVLLVLRAGARRGARFGPSGPGLDLEAGNGGTCCARRADLETNGIVMLEGAGRAFAGGATAQRIYAVVPDGVARVSFISPPHRSPSGTAVYRSTLRITVPVQANVAAVQWQRQCCSGPIMVWYAADGHVIRRVGNVRASAALRAPQRAPSPAPETALSRQAQRDPDTPNPVTVTPRAWQLGPGREHPPLAASFAILVPGQTYRATMHAPAGCRTVIEDYSVEPVFDDPGRRFSIPLIPQGHWRWCPGPYAVTVAVIRRGHRAIRALPFGGASFTLRR